MSKVKHKGYRKVLDVSEDSVIHGNQALPIKTVVWCIVEAETSRTIKTDHIGVTVYIESLKYSGVDARFLNCSIKRNNPMDSKVFTEIDLERVKIKAGQNAYRYFLTQNPAESKNRTGVVSWFDLECSKGFITDKKTGLGFVVYGCNINGAKTGFCSTACMFLKKGETVEYDLSDFGDHVTAVSVRGNVHFDAKKWDSLDKKKLAFKTDKNRKFINGLFGE